MDYIYLYGMILSTRSIRLQGDYPKPDSYSEIAEQYYGVGGETGTAAVILNSLGCKIKLAGAHLGTSNRDVVKNHFKGSNADLSELVCDEKFRGVEDLVLIDRNTRTCFGQFGALYAGALDWVEPPSEQSVKDCAVVGCDPYFGDEIARLCVRHHKKYAVIDCAHDSMLNQNCAVNAISHEFLDGQYPGMDYRELLKLYTDNTHGLVIFTQGEGKLLYGRRGGEPHSFSAFTVDVESTLGAGDSFKAGTVYGLYKGLPDEELVRFAAATAAYSCAHYPIAEHPATLDGVGEIIASRKRG